MTAPIASGWSGCRVGLAPTGKRRLCTAHAKTGLTFADLVRRKGVKERSCSPAYLAAKRRAATPEVEKLQIRAAMKATPIPRSDLIMLTRLSH
jgi:hypothetical protein